MVMQRWLMAACILLGSAASALSEDVDRRVALVLGYSAYEQLPPLDNPVNDAGAFAALLRDVGFEVVEGLDQTREQALATFREFADVVEGAEIGLIYYAGHGIQVSGRNYLVPVDAAPRVAADLAFDGIAMDDLMRQVQARSKTVLFFLDACRDNPLPTHVASAQGASRSLDAAQGLAPVSVDVGSFTSYATGPNRVAYDGDGENSPYTTALLEHMATPGLEIRQAMDLVRRSVITATDGLQVPWDHSALMGPVRLVDEGGQAPIREAPAVADADGVFWNTLQKIAAPDLREAALVIYQRAFPSGRFAEVAELQLASFEQTVATEEAPAPEIVPAVATNEFSDLLYWNEVSRDQLGPDEAKSYLDRFPNGLFSAEARAELVDEEIQVAALDQQQRSLQTIELITSGGPQLLNLPIPTGDGLAEATIVELPVGRLSHPERGTLQVGNSLVLADLGAIRFEPLGESRKDYGEIVLAANQADAEPMEWSTPIAVTTHDCDQLASDPLDPNRVSSGTFFFDGRFSEEDKDLWANGAVIACLKGASDYPEVERFRANLGRAYAGIEDYEEAKAWLGPLVERDNPLAQNLMGMMYKNGWGVEQSYEKAAPLFMAAAKTGHAGAQHDIAWAYGEGRGLPKDDAKMAEWMARSAASGYHQAQYNLGRLHLWGRGIERDVDKAIDLLKQAAVQGQMRANYDLAALHEKGEGFDKDEARARQLYQTAVKAEYPPAYFSYARMLLEGRGGEKDVKGGVYHMALAATGSSVRTAENAVKALAELPKSDVVRVVQEALTAAGQQPGPADGVMGGRTQAALDAYRAQQGLDQSTDILDPATLAALLAPSRKI